MWDARGAARAVRGLGSTLTLNRMRAPLTEELLDEKAARAAGAGGHRDLARQMLAWADHPHERDEVPVADLLVGAGEQFALAEEYASALEAYLRAAERPEVTSPDARGFVVQALLDLGRTSEAEQAAEELRRSRPNTAATYHLVGEAWEAAGRLEEANRWLTRGALLAERQDAQMDWAMLLIGRLRVRRALGFPPDDYDEAALQIVLESRAELATDAEDPVEEGAVGSLPTRAVLSREGANTVLDLF